MLRDEDMNEAMRSLCSSEPETRSQGLMSLWTAMQPDLRTLCARYAGSEDANDLLQSLFVKVFARLIDAPLRNVKAPAAFIRQSVRNLAIDYHRRRRISLTVPLDELPDGDFVGHHSALYAPSAEDVMFEQMSMEESEALTWRLVRNLPKPWDRQMAILRGIAGLTPGQVATLTGWDIKDVRNREKRYKRRLRRFVHSDDSNWDAPVAIGHHPTAADGRDVLGVTHYNIGVRDILPECNAQICLDLGVRDMDEARQQFIFMLRVDGVNLDSPHLTLTLAHRRSMRSAFLQEGNVEYVDYQPTFLRQQHNSLETWMIGLDRMVEYSGRLLDKRFDWEAPAIACEWRMKRLNLVVHTTLKEGGLDCHDQIPEAQEEFCSAYVTRLNDQPPSTQPK